MDKKNVVVVMGGFSSEFEISLLSGKVVCESLDNTIYTIFPVHILKDCWYHLNSAGDQIRINRDDFSFFSGSERIIPDVIFNTVHGTPGEDGYLQAYWELIGIPHTSTGFYSAALSFNKRDCLTIVKRFGVNCAESCYLNSGDDINEDDILEKVGLPCFVKPNRAGSSFGVSKVSHKGELLSSIEKAFKEDHQIIIETALKGVEVSVGVYNHGDKVISLPVTEIVSQNEFFDYEAKYLGRSEEITPARISQSETKLVQEEAKRIYKLLNMKGVTRSDFIIQEGIPYFIEINTTPGLSKESIIPKQVRETGMSLSTFFGILVENALIKK